MTSGRRSRANRVLATSGGIASSTGIVVEARHKAHGPLPEPDGTHFWTLASMYRVADPGARTFNLDIENLLTIEGPGCLHCAAIYSPDNARRPCSGVMP